MGCSQSKPLPSTCIDTMPTVCIKTTPPRIDVHPVATSVMKQFSSLLPQESLAALLRDEKTARRFRDFLVENYSETSLYFYEAVTRLLECHEEESEVMLVLNMIIEEYIMPGSEHEITLPANCRSACIRKDVDLVAKRATLESARREILRLMAFDLFPRFLKSRHYTGLLEQSIERGASGSRVVHWHASLNREGVLNSATQNVSNNEKLQSVPATPITAGRHGAHDAIIDSSWLRGFIAMSDLLPVCITLADATLVNLPLIYVNSEFLRMTGYAWEDICGRNCRFLQGPATDRATVTLLRESLSAHADVRVELVNYRKDGTPFKNLLAMRHVVEYASEADALAKRNGVFRYIIGVQYEATSDSMVESRIIQLGALIKFLPVIVVP